MASGISIPRLRLAVALVDLYRPNLEHDIPILNARIQRLSDHLKTSPHAAEISINNKIVDLHQQFDSLPSKIFLYQETCRVISFLTNKQQRATQNRPEIEQEIQNSRARLQGLYFDYISTFAYCLSKVIQLEEILQIRIRSLGRATNP